MAKVDFYRERMMDATRAARTEERALQARIAKLYELAAEDMARKAADAKAGSLTEAHAQALTRSLRARSRELWGTVKDATEEGMRKAASRAVAVQTDFLLEIGQAAGIDLKPTLARVFGSTADDAVAHVMRGGIYGGNSPMLSKRIWDNEALQGGRIEQLIAQAVAKGESPVKLSRALEAYVNPKAAEPSHWNDVYDIPFDYKIEYNAKRLAVTSIRHAAWGASVAAARDNPFADYYHWELTPAHVIFDICDAHAVHDEGLGEGNFPIDALPLPHPWCTCLYYVDTQKSLEQIARELRGWLDGEENERLDLAFGEWEKSGGLAKPNIRPIAPRKEPVGYLDMGKINADLISEWEAMREDGVILTNERVRHINVRHPGDLDHFGPYIASVLRDPDFVLQDLRHPHTGIWVRAVEEADGNVRITVRHAVEGDPENQKNSIITLQRIRDKEYKRLSKQDDRMVYKRKN